MQGLFSTGLRAAALAIPLTFAMNVIPAGAAVFNITDVHPTCGGGQGIDGFDGCEYDNSPIIAKFNFDDGTPGLEELNTAVFPSIDGGEFTVNFTGTGFSQGTWSYSPGVGDPTTITAFSIRGGTPDGTDRVTYIWDPTSGLDYTDIPWAMANDAALSNIMWFDTGVTPIPVPAALPMFLAALVGLGFLGWRRRSAFA